MITEQIKDMFGNRIRECQRFGNRRELFVEFPIGDDAHKLLELMKENGYSAVSERKVSRNRYFTFITDEGVMYICIADKLGCIRIYVEITDDPYKGVKEQDASGAAHLTLMNMAYEDDIQVSHDNGLGMIVRLADGSFIIYDGGYATETDELYAFLKANTPGGKKPVISAWLLTHTHKDHYGCFDAFIRKYSDSIEIKAILACIIFDEYYAKKRVDDRYFTDILPSLAKEKGIPIVTPISGQIYNFAGMDMEVLQTAEDLYPMGVSMENHSSTVTRLMFTEQKKNVLITADLARSAVNFLTDSFGELLKCDILQIPHHAHSGATKELYRLTDPDTVLFATSKEKYLQRAENNEAWNHYLLNDLNVKKVIVADDEYQMIL